MKKAPSFPLEDFQATVWLWPCPFSHGSGECEVILACLSEKPSVTTLGLSNGGQKQGTCVCHLLKRTRFEESIISEWDDSTGLGMKRVSVLEQRYCLREWERAVGEKGLWAAAGPRPLSIVCGHSSFSFPSHSCLQPELPGDSSACVWITQTTHSSPVHSLPQALCFTCPLLGI